MLEQVRLDQLARRRVDQLARRRVDQLASRRVDQLARRRVDQLANQVQHTQRGSDRCSQGSCSQICASNGGRMCSQVPQPRYQMRLDTISQLGGGQISQLRYFGGKTAAARVLRSTCQNNIFPLNIINNIFSSHVFSGQLAKIIFFL